MNVSFSVAWTLVIRTIFNITSNCKHLKTVGHETIGTRFFYSVCVCFAKSFLLLTLILVSKGQWWIRKQQAPRIRAGDGGQKLWSVLQILSLASRQQICSKNCFEVFAVLKVIFRPSFPIILDWIQELYKKKSASPGSVMNVNYFYHKSKYIK